MSISLSTPPIPPASASASASITMTPSASAPANSRRVPLDKRKRTETSCDKCKSRKQKCRKEPGQDACRYCIVHNIECLTTQPRKKRLYGSVEGLGNRLALLESLVKGLLPEADVSNMDEMRQLGVSLGIPLPDTPSAEQQGDNLTTSDREGDETLSLLPDQQGQVQYIGPASSFSFHLKLRSLVGSGPIREFVLFGRNAADQEPIDDNGNGDPHALSTPSATSNIDTNSPADHRAHSSSVEAPSPSLETLISAFFDNINLDFPVLHEALFREEYEAWLGDPAKADPAWLCGFLSVLLLARRVARVTFPEDQERLWWRRVQTLLPVVIFTSSVSAVQALMLAALHLHNTNHRDACWNLTGTAIRIAFAIGLHQDKVNTMQTPLARELRKRLWWTLYAFEQMQVSSYDRPSAIEHPGSKISCPNERIIGMASYCPPDYSKWFNRMVVHLGSACRAPKNTKPNASEESYVGPLSPAAAVLRDMERWRDSIPQDLRMEALETAPPTFHRPLLLLHALYHYTVIVLCRSALLARATILSKEGKDSPNTALTGMSDSCTDSGRALAKILLRLESINKFDPVTWWDIFYALAASSTLVLDLVCLDKMAGTELSESRILLAQLADLSTRHRRNPHMPGTLEKFASLLPELHSMADSITTQSPPDLEMKHEEIPVPEASLPEQMPQQPHQQQQPQQQQPQQSQPQPQQQSQPPHQPQQETHPHQQPQTHHVVPYNYQSTTNSGAYMFADNMPGRYYQENDFNGTPYSTTRFDRSTQMNFMDFTINNIQEWNWNDLGSLLGTEALHSVHSVHPPNPHHQQQHQHQQHHPPPHPPPHSHPPGPS